MEFTKETINQVSLEQLIDEVENYKQQVEAGKNVRYLKKLSVIDMFYLVKHHAEKDKLPEELVAFMEEIVIKQENDLHGRHATESVNNNEYKILRKLCLASFYVEKNVYADVWSIVAKNAKKSLMAFFPETAKNGLDAPEFGLGAKTVEELEKISLNSLKMLLNEARNRAFIDIEKRLIDKPYFLKNDQFTIFELIYMVVEVHWEEFKEDLRTLKDLSKLLGHKPGVPDIPGISEDDYLKYMACQEFDIKLEIVSFKAEVRAMK